MHAFDKRGRSGWFTRFRVHALGGHAKELNKVGFPDVDCRAINLSLCVLCVEGPQLGDVLRCVSVGVLSAAVRELTPNVIKNGDVALSQQGFV